MNQHPHQLRGGVNPPSNLLLQQAEHLASNRRIRTTLERVSSYCPRLAPKLATHITNINQISKEILSGGRSNQTSPAQAKSAT